MKNIRLVKDFGSFKVEVKVLFFWFEEERYTDRLKNLARFIVPDAGIMFFTDDQMILAFKELTKNNGVIS